MGLYFDYAPGHLEARFSHDLQFDYINLDLRLGGDVTSVTAYDPQGRSFGPEVRQQRASVEIQVYVSSVFCPFRDFVSFLEAICVGVQECAFTWDAEGPTGEFRWQRSGDAAGQLAVHWSSSGGRIRWQTQLRTSHVIETLYHAFRSFVESPAYDPLRYERLTRGEALRCVLKPESLDELCRSLAGLDAQAAAAVIVQMEDVAQARTMAGPASTFPIAHYLSLADPCRVVDGLLPDDWDTWTFEQRLMQLDEFLRTEVSSWEGENLRAMRSMLVEDWLARNSDC